jgi:3-deoxy-7-phosphoheptulonate synthase
MDTIGLREMPQLNSVSFYTSHEALLLDYEEALTRVDTTTGDWYDSSAHMVWVGDRTRQLDGAHVEFMRGIKNPLGIKVGPDYRLDEIITLVDRLNPGNEPGRISLITRFGVGFIKDKLPDLVRRVRQEGFQVVWICDPMHGNTHCNADGRKTRRYDEIVDEIRCFWEILNSYKSIAGGVHLELTGTGVTECTGGSGSLSEDDLQVNYQTRCDPRLNAEQSVELAFALAEMMNEFKNEG